MDVFFRRTLIGGFCVYSFGATPPLRNATPAFRLCQPLPPMLKIIPPFKRPKAPPYQQWVAMSIPCQRKQTVRVANALQVTVTTVVAEFAKAPTTEPIKPRVFHNYCFRSHCVSVIYEQTNPIRPTLSWSQRQPQSSASTAMHMPFREVNVWFSVIYSHFTRRLVRRNWFMCKVGIWRWIVVFVDHWSLFG